MKSFKIYFEKENLSKLKKLILIDCKNLISLDNKKI